MIARFRCQNNKGEVWKYSLVKKENELILGTPGGRFTTEVPTVGEFSYTGSDNLVLSTELI